jgi:rSAM/selenodomain-associated transferase 1
VPPTLGVFAKQPTAGRVKTRLAAATSPAWAAEVAEAFLRDLLDQLAGVPARRVVVFDPPDAAPFFRGIAADRYAVAPQGEGDLGQRLGRFCNDTLAAGAGGVVVVGTDSPTMPRQFILEALNAMNAADVVLGPATDGGYYLLGCRAWFPELFTDIAWSSSRVLGQTVAKVRGLSLRLHLLPPWYDVDTLDDWHTLAGHLAALRLAGADPRIPRTEALLSQPIPFGKESEAGVG